MKPLAAARLALRRRTPRTAAQAILPGAQQHHHPRLYNQEATPTTLSYEAAQTFPQGKRTNLRKIRPNVEHPDELDPVNEGYRKFLRQPKPTTFYGSGDRLLARVGKCLSFGCDPEQTAEAARIVRIAVEHWPRLQMSVTNAPVAPEAALRARLDYTKKDVSWEPESPTRGMIPRAFPQPHIVEQAAMKFLDYVVETASPEAREHWMRIQKRQRKLGRIESHQIRPPPPRPPLYCRDVSFSALTLHGRQRLSKNIVAYTGVDSMEELDDRTRFTLRVTMWSLTSNTFVAEAKALMIFKSPNGAVSWFIKELERMLNFTSDEASEELRDLLQAVTRLEQETWNRDDAVEDLGSAQF